MAVHESKAKISRIHTPKARRRSLVVTKARRGSLVARKPKKVRKKGKLVTSPLGAAGVKAAAARAGIRLSGPFGL